MTTNTQVRFYISIFIPLLAILLVSCSKVVTEQDLFYPRKYPIISDDIQRKNISIVINDSTTVRGWHLDNPSSEQSLIYFYGNGETVYNSLFRLYWLASNLECDVFSIDYRGYGFSDGKPSFKSISDDVIREFDYIMDFVNSKDTPVFIYGRSIGTVFAQNIAYNRDINGLILEAPMTTAEETVPEWEKLLPWYVRIFIDLKADSTLLNMQPQPIQMISKIDCPLLIIHGTEDKQIPIKFGKRMYDLSISKDKHFCEVPGKGHNNLPISVSPVSDSLRAFIGKYGNPQ